MAYDFCFLVSEYTGGGIARIVTDIASQLGRNGKKGAIVSLHAHDKYKLKVDPSVDIIHLDEQAFVGGVFALKNWVRKNNPQAIISCDKPISKKLIIAARVLSNYRGKIIVMQSQRLFELPLSNENEEISENSFGNRILKWLYKKADLVIAKSRTIEEELLSIVPKDKIQMLHGPIDIKAIQAQALMPIPHPWLANKEMPVIVSMGRMVPAKGFETLLRAFLLARERRPMRLIMLGDGYHKEYLEHLAKNLGISDAVAFPGYTSNPYVYLKNADLFVLSSEHEGFSLPLAEAIACGCNVVVTECCKEPAEMINHGEFGTLVPSKSSALMEQAILYRLDHLIPAEVLQQQVSQYDIGAIAKEYEGLLTS